MTKTANINVRIDPETKSGAEKLFASFAITITDAINIFTKINYGGRLTLLKEMPLAERHRDHSLTGNYTGFRECHVLPDWLLIDVIRQDKLLLTASRTGTHFNLLGM